MLNLYLDIGGYPMNIDSRTVGICFGRFNPPHKGHKAMWEIASQFDDYYVGTNPDTHGQHDPLPISVKLLAMQTIMPSITQHIVITKNLFSLAAGIYADLGDGIDLYVCTDENWLTDRLNMYNGIVNTHGFFKFRTIQHVLTPRLATASNLREAVRIGDREMFTNEAGISADTEIELNTRVIKFFDIIEEFLEYD